jgi:hypothetical protein
MTTAIRIDTIALATLPESLIPAREDGILARVRRKCGEHGCECRCVGHLEDEGCLVFWCAHGEHVVTFR